MENIVKQDGLSLSVTDLRESFAQGMALWEKACRESEHNYYVSPGWIRVWCETLPAEYTPYLLTVYCGQQPQYMCVFTRSEVKRNGFLNSKVLCIYSTGNYDIDSVCSEYNHFLTLSDCRIALREVIKRIPFAWDEIFMPGFCTKHFPGNNLQAYDSKWKITDYDKPVYYVELDSIGKTLDSYLKTLSPNTRTQIRRSIKYFESLGKITVEESQSMEEASYMLYKLNSLSTSRHESKGVVSSFEIKHYNYFNNKLIEKRYAHNEIQMLKICAGKHVIGYIYSFIYHGFVHFYQCGFNYFPDNKVRPGLVSHAYAIVHNAKLGHKVYDFGAGYERYKKSLSNSSSNMLWVRILRPSLKMFLFRHLKIVKELIRSKLKTSA